eukprot:gene12899-9229_t
MSHYSKHDDSDSDIFGIAAQHVDDDDDLALHDTGGQDNATTEANWDIYPADKSFRVQDPKKNAFKNFNAIERVFSGDNRSVPSEVGITVNRTTSADHEDISDDDSGAHYKRKSVSSSADDVPMTASPLNLVPKRPVVPSSVQPPQPPAAQVKSPAPVSATVSPMKPPTHPHRQSLPPQTTTSSTPPPQPQPPAHHHRRSPSPSPSQQQQHSSRSPSPSREGVRFSVNDHHYHFGHYSPSADQQMLPSEPVFSPVRPISPQSHLLSTTRARIIEHELAHEQLALLHQSAHRAPKHTIPAPTGANFLRPTVAFTKSTDFRLELERRQEKRDIWWEERKTLPKAPSSPLTDNVKSRLYEPTQAYKESVRSPANRDGGASRDISPSRGRTKQIAADSSLLRATKAAKHAYKVTPPPPKEPTPRLSLVGQQSYPQAHQVTSKLAQETTAARMSKWKVAEQLKEEEDRRYLERKRAAALHDAELHHPASPGSPIPIAPPIKAPSDRLLNFNAAMQHQARGKVDVEQLHHDPGDQGPGWNKLFTRDRIDPEPFRSRSPSPSSSRRLRASRSLSPSSSLSRSTTSVPTTPQSAAKPPATPTSAATPPPPPLTTTSALKKPARASTGGIAEQKAKRVSLSPAVAAAPKSRNSLPAGRSAAKASTTTTLRRRSPKAAEADAQDEEEDVAPFTVDDLSAAVDEAAAGGAGSGEAAVDDAAPAATQATA